MSDRRRNTAVVVSCLFAGAAIVYAVRVVGLPAGGSSNTGTGAVPDEAGVVRLESIDTFDRIESPEHAARIGQRIADGSLSQLSNADEGADVPYESQLRELIRERVRLTLDPDYDAYVRHVGELLGRDGASALQGTLFGDPKMWSAFAEPNRQAHVAIDSARATLGYGALSLGEGMAGGRQTSMTDPEIYGAKALAESGAPRVDVEIPMMLPPTHDGPDASVMVVFVTMRFVLDASRGVWLPYQTVTSDPTGTYEQMAAMWI